MLMLCSYRENLFDFFFFFFPRMNTIGCHAWYFEWSLKSVLHCIFITTYDLGICINKQCRTFCGCISVSYLEMPCSSIFACIDSCRLSQSSYFCCNEGGLSEDTSSWARIHKSSRSRTISAESHEISGQRQDAGTRYSCAPSSERNVASLDASEDGMSHFSTDIFPHFVLSHGFLVSVCLCIPGGRDLDLRARRKWRKHGCNLRELRRTLYYCCIRDEVKVLLPHKHKGLGL